MDSLLSRKKLSLSNVTALAEFATVLPEINLEIQAGLIHAKSIFREFNFLLVTHSLQVPTLSRWLRGLEEKDSPHSIWLVGEQAKAMEHVIGCLWKHSNSRTLTAVSVNPSNFCSALQDVEHNLSIIDCIDYTSAPEFSSAHHPLFGSFQSAEVKLRVRLSKIQPRRFWHFLVTDYDDVIGSITLFIESHICGIYDLTVTESYRGQRIGATMLAIAMNHAKQNACNSVVAQVLPESLEFYRKAGFLMLGEILVVARDF